MEVLLIAMQNVYVIRRFKKANCKGFSVVIIRYILTIIAVIIPGIIDVIVV